MSTFTLVHVVISLVGIVSGFVVAYGMLTGKRVAGGTVVFLASTVLTSVTGFLFPFHRFLPSHGVGIVSLVLLAVAIAALYIFHLAGGWRRVYVIAAITALYLNRSEEHTSELQSRGHLVCRLLLEKKKS